jgi:general secretion pathway protein G
MKSRNGFTLVELLIVVIILGILAAIVIPQFSDASSEAKYNSLTSNLATIRSQIQLYKVQHNGLLPGGGSASVTDSLTKYTTVDGSLAATQAPGAGVYGPYLQQIPKNPYNSSDKAATITNDGTLGDNSGGWEFNTTTGAFQADDSKAHSDL